MAENKDEMGKKLAENKDEIGLKKGIFLTCSNTLSVKSRTNWRRSASGV